jgi:thioredoxin-like negative regulator of GroEL
VVKSGWRTLFWWIKTMFYVFITGVLLTAASRSVQRARNAPAAASNVTQLANVDELQSLVRRNDGVVVKFILPYCAKCMRVAENFEMLATKLMARRVRVALASVDCRRHPTWCSHVRYAPTTYFFKPLSEPLLYDGDYGERSLFEFIEAGLAAERRARPSDAAEVPERLYKSKF